MCAFSISPFLCSGCSTTSSSLKMASQIKDKEAFQRLNFLYQAAHCVLAANPENVELARFYCHTEKTIGKRLVLRQDPSIKRTICKRCSSLLLSGITCTVRQRKRRGQRLTIVRCLSCGLTKPFLNNPNYKLWSEQPEALLENQPKPDMNPGSHQNLPKERNESSAETQNAIKITS
ncbi:ribonuclease P protein subunit p21 isoform X1 [Hyla sarda]|uniref:ribonuclease P protein subunit p21 isoform X1 n=2 Tax=Hyla sarda TaxID=327740 RepID=UPI0024C3E6D3|nr:ribonuclease P protein subunit p21 isoform X1 [Hyla sarda]